MPIPISFLEPNLYMALENEYPMLLDKPIPEHELPLLTNHELWSILAGIKLKDKITALDIDNRRKCRDELCIRYPKLICPVCKEKFVDDKNFNPSLVSSMASATGADNVTT